MNMDTQDIEAMFAAAAGAAEDTGEKDSDVYGKDAPKQVKQETPKRKPVEEKPPVYETKTKVEKQEPIKTSPVEPVKEPVKEIVKEQVKEPARNPIIKDRTTGIINNPKGITEDSITKILDMNRIYDKFDETQKEFVSGYFRLDEGDKNVSKVIYGALVASQRDLDALSKIVEAKGFDPAGRAFFLMGLDNSTIEDVFEQVELLTGELGKLSKVNEINKLEICRKIEAVVSGMPKDVFTYIEKLQVFTNRAMDK